MDRASSADRSSRSRRATRWAISYRSCRMRQMQSLLRGVIALSLALLICGIAYAQHDHGAHQHSSAATPAAEGSFFNNLLKVYVPRKACMFYEQPVIWLHMISDLFIAAAYYSIPFALVYFVRRR